MDRPRSLIFIPALNEASSISSVVSGCLALGDVLVLDDGSTDSTATLAKAAGAIVVQNTTPKGYDNAIRTGFLYGAREAYDIFVTCDADGQHRIEDIGSILETIKERPDAAIVIGKRDKFGRNSERLFGMVSRYLVGVTDPLSGLKAYRLANLDGLYSLVGVNVGTAILTEAKSRNKIMVEDPIRIETRKEGVSRFGTNIRGELKILGAIFMFVIGALRPKTSG